MSSQFQRTFTVPPEFPRLLKGLTREVLRAQPDNIYVFAADYFAHQLRQRDGKKSLASGDLSTEELEQIIMECFMQADTDGSGTLDRREFKALITSLDLNLSNRELRAVMAEADENEDGVLEYREFVPVMVELVNVIRARRAAAAAAEEEEAAARDAAESFLLRGVPREALEEMMRSVFASADANGNGTLSRKEFTACLRSAKLGLTRRDINLLLAEVELEENGEVSYESFLPLCFNILVERFKFDMLHNAALQSGDELTALLTQAFAAAGAGADGLLPLAAARGALAALSDDVLGMSQLQILSVMSAAPVADNGLVDCLAFAPTAAAMIWSIIDTSRAEARVKAINELGSRLADEGAERLTRFDPAGFRELLMGEFEAADAEGAGVLPAAVVDDILLALAQGALELTQAEFLSLRAAVEPDGEGNVAYTPLCDFLFEVLEHMAREQYIAEAAAAYYAEITGGAQGDA